MTEHYFSKKPQAESSRKTWQANLRDKDYMFTSDTNVFSKEKVDYGTRLLIETFEEPQVAGGLLDLGCGYGPIGIALAAEYPSRQVVLADVNERAIALAKENAKKNNITNIEVIQSDRFNGVGDREFAAVITNPPIRAGKQIVHGMFEGAVSHLVENGELWVVIQKKQGAPSAQKKIEELFGNVDVVARKKGYYILRALKV